MLEISNCFGLTGRILEILLVVRNLRIHSIKQHVKPSVVVDHIAKLLQDWMKIFRVSVDMFHSLFHPVAMVPLILGEPVTSSIRE